jgi:anti-repressor protein
MMDQNIVQLRPGDQGASAVALGEVMPFVFDGGAVRVVDMNGEPGFVAKDVAERLGYEWNGNARIRHVPEDWRGVTSVVTPSGVQQMAILMEPGLWFFLNRSDKPKALPLQRWLAGEVLPALRRTGGYMVAAPDETPEALALRAMAVLQATVDRQKAQIALIGPKADALDRIASADGSLSITDAAKALQARPKDLFAFLQAHGWIYRRTGADHFVGYQARVQSGDLEHKVTTVLRSDGSEKVTEQVRVTPKGLAKLAKLLPPAVKEFA